MRKEHDFCAVSLQGHLTHKPFNREDNLLVRNMISVLYHCKDISLTNLSTVRTIYLFATLFFFLCVNHVTDTEGA